MNLCCVCSRKRGNAKWRPLSAPRTAAVFMIGRGGSGHKASAEAVRACLLEGDTEPSLSSLDCIELVDAASLLEMRLHGQILPSGDDVYNWLMKGGYYTAAGYIGHVASWGVKHNRAGLESVFMDFFEEQQPAIVVSFVPFLNVAMRTALLRSCPDCWFVTVITDMSNSVAHPWIDPWDETAANHVIVAGTAELEAQARELGYHEFMLRTSGMVVHPRFYVGTGRESDHPGRTKIVIFFGGFPPSRTELVARNAMRSHLDWDIVVLCGANEDLFNRLQLLVKEGSRCVVEGFIAPDKIREHFVGATCILGKPGPGVVAEASVCQIPFVTERRRAMPQERSVLKWLETSGVGVIVEDLERLPPDLLARVAACKEVLAAQPQNRAVFEVAAHLKSLVHQPPSVLPSAPVPMLMPVAYGACTTKMVSKD